MCPRRRPPAPETQCDEVRGGEAFRGLALALLRRARTKRLWGLLGHYLKENKDPSIHRKRLGTRWSCLGARLNISKNRESDEDN